jgi:hypothetical protein
MLSSDSEWAFATEKLNKKTELISLKNKTKA